MCAGAAHHLKKNLSSQLMDGKSNHKTQAAYSDGMLVVERGLFKDIIYKECMK